MEVIDYSATSKKQTIKEDLYYPDDDCREDYNGDDFIEDEDRDDNAKYILMNGEKIHEGPIDIYDAVF